MTATSSSDFDDKENSITVCCSPCCALPKTLILHDHFFALAIDMAARLGLALPFSPWKSSARTRCNISHCSYRYDEGNLKLPIIFSQQAYVYHLIISRCNRGVYNSHNYCNFQEESLTNVNLFLPNKNYLLTKLDIEKDSAGQSCLTWYLIRKEQCFEHTNFMDPSEKLFTLKRYQPVCVLSSGNPTRHVYNSGIRYNDNYEK